MSSIITHRDQEKLPQSVIEGITAATYGVAPANPDFVSFGRDQSLVESTTPTVAELRVAGDIDRKLTTKTREANTVNYKQKILATDAAILKWGINKPNGAGTPDESRTFLDSYIDVNPVEVFRVFRGCKPQSVTLTKDNAGYQMFEATLSVKSIDETHNPNVIQLGSGSWAEPSTAAPLAQSDSGLENFEFNNVMYDFRSFTLSVAYTEAMKDSSGSLTDLYRTPTQRAISGSIDIFKQGSALQVAARAVAEEDALLVLKEGTHNYANGTFVCWEDEVYNASQAHTSKISRMPPNATYWTPVTTVNWVAGVTYAAGTSLRYNGKCYRANQSHSSSAGNAPPNPANWTEVPQWQTGGLALQFTKFKFMPSGEDMSGDTSDTTIESKSFEAAGVEVIA